jgi:8-oxo-dGTP diphosphatase/2-hydroxy-dATP diphosphatase
MINHEESYKKTTIVFPIVESKILLGMKKRGFGKDWWNGFGGKLENGETYDECATRECLEEAGIEVGQLKHTANLHFFFDDILKVVSKAYTSDGFSGSPMESDEMKPELFDIDDLPYDDMWPADRIWVPKSLNSDKPLGFIVNFKNNAVESVQEVDYQNLEDKF